MSFECEVKEEETANCRDNFQYPKKITHRTKIMKCTHKYENSLRQLYTILQNSSYKRDTTKEPLWLIIWTEDLFIEKILSCD